MDDTSAREPTNSNNVDFHEIPVAENQQKMIVDKYLDGSSANNGASHHREAIEPEEEQELAKRDNKRLAKVRKLLKDFWKPKEKVSGPHPEKMAPNEAAKIDLERPLSAPKETIERFGINGKLVAEINAGGKIFYIIDVRESGANRDFHIIDDSYKPENNRQGLKGISTATGEVTIGRGHHRERFDYPATVSINHFKVRYDSSKDNGTGELIVTNMEPTNETILTANKKNLEEELPHQQIPIIDDERTRRGVERLLNNPNYRLPDENGPYGYYFGHPLLGRNSDSVDNGVYLGGGSREAIVVNGKSEILNDVYEDLARKFRSSYKDAQTIIPNVMLKQVMQKVKDVMPYNGPRTSEISKEFYGDQIIELSSYVKEKAGVCRQQGLLAAYLTERLIKDGFLNGAIGIERNTVEDFGGTHAWAVFKPAGGGAENTIVIDPAQTFVGTKSQADKEGRWAYRLSTDEY
jgi:hypothetical protein